MVNDTNSLIASNPKMTIIIILGTAASCFDEKQPSLYIFCENMPVHLLQLEKSTQNH